MYALAVTKLFHCTCWALAEEAHVHLIREGLACDDLHLFAKAPQALRGGLHSQPAAAAVAAAVHQLRHDTRTSVL
jgi:hypothetical protein